MNALKMILLTALGSFFGGALRMIVILLYKELFGKMSFPWVTLVINLLGCFLIGVLFALYKDRASIYTMVSIGILGGFTTFSTFSLEVFQLFEQNEPIKAVFYVGMSVLLGIGVCFLGIKIGSV